MKKKLFAKVISLLLVMVMVLPLVACNNGNTSDDGTTTLIMYTRADIQSGMDEMIEAVNVYLKEKLNVKLDLRLSANYDSTMSTRIDAREDWDICLVGIGVDFDSYAKRHAFAPITDYVDQLPKTTGQLIEGALDSLTIDGEVYAVPILKDMFVRYAWTINQTMIDDLGVSFPEEWATKWDVVDFLYEVLEARNDKYPEIADDPTASLVGDVFYDYDQWFVSERLIGGYNLPLVDVNISEQYGYKGIPLNDTCFCPVYTQEFRDLMKQVRDMVSDGIGSFDPKGINIEYEMNAGNLVGSCGTGLISVPEISSGGYTQKLYPSSVVYADDYKYGFAINAACENVELAVQVLELLQNDPYLATTLHFGKEGSGWTDKDNDGVIELTEANSDPRNRLWYSWYGWTLGGVTAMKTIPGSSTTYMDELKALNMSAPAKPNRGFKFDTDPVADKILSVSNIYAEYFNVLMKGTNSDVDGLIDTFISKLKAAGMDDIIAECQSQLDAWRAANGK